jgi:hypothetical protein
MAFLGLIPRRLYDINPPKCAACCFGKAMKRPWRTKVKPGMIYEYRQEPGEYGLGLTTPLPHFFHTGDVTS